MTEQHIPQREIPSFRRRLLNAGEFGAELISHMAQGAVWGALGGAHDVIANRYKVRHTLEEIENYVNEEANHDNS